MDSFFSGGAGSKTKTTGTFDPSIEAYYALKTMLASQTAAGGLPASMKGYIDKIVVPSTVNTMTAGGLGRSGAVGEAVSNATLSLGTQFITALLSGSPSTIPTTTTAQTTPGALDWLGALANIVGLWGKGGPFGSTYSWLTSFLR